MRKMLTYMLALLICVAAGSVTVHAEPEGAYGEFLGEILLDESNTINSCSKIRADFVLAEVYKQPCAKFSIDVYGYVSVPDMYGYVSTSDVPYRMKCEQARYAVIEYYNPYGIAELGLIWRNDVYYHGVNYDSPQIVQLNAANDKWQYLIVDMSDHELWTGTLYNFGFLMYTESGTENFTVWLRSVRFFAENPTALYDALEPETFFPENGAVDETVPPEEFETPFIDWETEPVTEPIVEDTLADELETEETPGDKPERPGLFYEFFGDVEWTGCKRTSPGYTGLGCMGTGCTSAAGGLLLLPLIAAGLVFRKKDE